MNSVHLCLILWALVATAASQDTPKIRTVSPTIAEIVGNSISLECLVENYEANTLMWSRGPILERRLLSMGQLLLVHDDRYSATFDRNSSTYKLQIRNIDFSDAGVYQCLLPLAMDNILTSDVEVQVFPKPGEIAFDWNVTESSLSKSEGEPDESPRITRVSPTQIAEVGGNVTLECELENAPSIAVVWIKKRDDIYQRYMDTATALLFRDSRVTKTTTDNVTLCTLKLDNLKLVDAWTYQCVLIRSPEDLVTADVEVQVHSESLATI